MFDFGFSPAAFFAPQSAASLLLHFRHLFAEKIDTVLANKVSLGIPCIAYSFHAPIKSSD